MLTNPSATQFHISVIVQLHQLIVYSTSKTVAIFTKTLRVLVLLWMEICADKWKAKDNIQAAVRNKRPRRDATHSL